MSLCGADSVGYNYTARRLNTAGYWCLYSAGGCDTDTAVYDTTNRRLKRFIESVGRRSKCTAVNLVDYDSTNKRLKYTAKSSVPCVA